MRKAVGMLAATALLLPVGLLASPAGAATGVSCKTATGSATFSPALPKMGSATKVKSTITITGAKLGGCTGGVTSGTLNAKLTFSTGSNCSMLLAGAQRGHQGHRDHHLEHQEDVDRRPDVEGPEEPDPDVGNRRDDCRALQGCEAVGQPAVHDPDRRLQQGRVDEGHVQAAHCDCDQVAADAHFCANQRSRRHPPPPGATGPLSRVRRPRPGTTSSGSRALASAGAGASVVHAVAERSWPSGAVRTAS